MATRGPSWTSWPPPPPMPLARCSGMPADVFVPASEAPASVRVAKKVCGECAELDGYRQYALGMPWLRGVWGASTSQERERERRLGRGGAVTDLADLEPTADELEALDRDEAEAFDERPALAELPTCPICVSRSASSASASGRRRAPNRSARPHENGCETRPASSAMARRRRRRQIGTVVPIWGHGTA